MKKIIIFCFLISLATFSYAAKLDINIVYEASTMKVKETVCGWQPDLSKGYLAAEGDCFMSKYELSVPMYGFTFEPISGPVPEPAKVAYYIAFFDSAFPAEDLVKTEIVAGGKPVKTVKGVKHERTFEGLVILNSGESIRFSSQSEPSYIYIYIIASIIVAGGMFLIIWKRK